MTDPRSCRSLELVGFASGKQSSSGGAHKAIGAGTDLHIHEQSSLCSEHLSVRRRYGLVIQDQSKVCLKLCLGLEQPQRPRTQQPAAVQSHGQEEG